MTRATTGCAIAHPVRRVAALIRVLTAAVLAGTCASTSADPATIADADIEMSGISGDPDAPRRHVRLRRAARLAPARAEAIYEIAGAAMADGYARSGLAPAREFGSWRRHNSFPYLSSRHGNHYLNNYANEIAQAYRCAERAGSMPVGSVIAKDSFAVTESGGILLGPLLLMEKMPAGFNDVSGDWRYTMVLPDGTVSGTTQGPGAARVQYCITCHLIAEKQDHMYFVPTEARADTCP